MSRLARVKGYTRKFRGKAVRVSGYLRKVVGTRRGKAAVAVAVLAAGGYGARKHVRKHARRFMRQRRANFRLGS